MELKLWLAFLVATTVIAISPGPGAVLSMSVGLRYGFRQALGSIAGLELALLLQLGVVALGLGAVLNASPTAFALIRLGGAAYLVWLGIERWRSATRIVPGIVPGVVHEAAAPSLPHSGRKLWLQGLLVNLTNPKAIIFMGAFVPQFIVPERPQALQLGIIGLTMVVSDVLVMGTYALLASRLRPLLQQPRHQRLQHRLFGAFFIGAGLMLAFSGSQ
jgi:homoserine/homoserine lactone efflux protein